MQTMNADWEVLLRKRKMCIERAKERLLRDDVCRRILFAQKFYLINRKSINGLLITKTLFRLKKLFSLLTFLALNGHRSKKHFMCSYSHFFFLIHSWRLLCVYFWCASYICVFIVWMLWNSKRILMQNGNKITHKLRTSFAFTFRPEKFFWTRAASSSSQLDLFFFIARCFIVCMMGRRMNSSWIEAQKLKLNDFLW